MAQSKDAKSGPEADDSLTDAIEKLTEEVVVLREAIDELRTNVQWLIDNRDDLGAAFQKSLDEISDDVQVLVRRAFQPWADRPQATDRRAFTEPYSATSEVCGTPQPAREAETALDELADDREVESAVVNLATEAPSQPMPTDPSPITFSESVNERATTTGHTRINSGPQPEQPRKRKPLIERIYFQRHLTDIVRAIGYEILAQEEARLRLQPLVEQYGSATVEAAVGELLEVESEGANATVRLTDQVRKLARQLLGPPPESRTATAREPDVRTSEPIVVPTTDISRLKPIKMTREKALAAFQTHLACRGVAFERIDDAVRYTYTDRYLGTLDFIARDDGDPPELITIRKAVTKTQRHDLAEWKAIVGAEATVSMIWRYRDDAGRESWETVSLELP